jgi:hypothetical protein
VYAFAEHHLNAMRIFAEHHDVHCLAAFGDANLDLFDIHVASVGVSCAKVYRVRQGNVRFAE